MFGWTGRSHLKQYMPAKSTQWGFKVWTLTDSKYGYVLKIIVYLGKKSEVNNDCLLGEQVVLELLELYFYLHFHVFFDNFFTSARLMIALLEKETYACGTVRLNRKGLPDEWKTKKGEPKLKLKPQEIRTLQQGQLTMTLWQDKRLVSVLSTNINAGNVIEKERVEKGNKRKLVTKPEVVCVYNQHMNGVDKHDQNHCYYSFGHRVIEWWKSFAFNLFNSILVNSYLLYKMAMEKSQQKVQGQLYFRKAIVEELLPRKVKNSLANHTKELRKSPRVCGLCKGLKQLTFRGGVVKTRFFCKQCAVSMCRSCFASIHSKN